jgi:hypothetical protein
MKWPQPKYTVKELSDLFEDWFGISRELSVSFEELVKRDAQRTSDEIKKREERRSRISVLPQEPGFWFEYLHEALRAA